MTLFKVYFIILWFASFFIFGNYADINEKKLLKYLFDPTRPDAHNIMERPVDDKDKPVKVKMSFSLIQLMNVDEKNQNMKVQMWFIMKWKDYHFNWEPVLYNGLAKINIPSEKLWKPDIYLYNSASQNFMVTYPSEIITKYTTSMIWVPPATFEANCLMDVTWFPFDKQRCTLMFGSWTYNINLVDIELLCPNSECSNKNCNNGTILDLRYYRENSEFFITYTSVHRYEMQFCNESYAYINVNIGVQRKFKYYIFNLIIPGIILSILALFMFTLPPDSKQKLSLGVIILLIITLFLLFVASKVPQTSNGVPIICKYFLCLMFLCSLSIIFTLLVLNIYHQSKEHSISSKVKDFINTWLAKVVFMKLENKSTNDKEQNDKEDRQFLSGSEKSSGDMKLVYKELTKISKKCANESDDFAKVEWKFAARVVDRFCFMVFASITIIMTIFFLI